MVTDGGPDGSYRRNAVGGFGDEWRYGYLYARALTIGGGTGEVQRSIVPERVFGLPATPTPAGPGPRSTTRPSRQADHFLTVASSFHYEQPDE